MDEQVEQVEVVVENVEKIECKMDVETARLEWISEQITKLGQIRIQMYERLLENNYSGDRNSIKDIDFVLDRLLMEFKNITGTNGKLS